MKKTISLSLALAMLISLLTMTFASAKEIDDAENLFFENGSIKILAYQMENGDTIFLRYENGILTQKNTVFANNDEIILREQYNEGEVLRDYLVIGDYITTGPRKIVPEPAALIQVGTINYRALYGGNYVYYGAKCSFSSRNEATTYVINGWVGSVVDLASIMLGSIPIGLSGAKLFIAALCRAAGIQLIGDVIKEALTTTVYCTATYYDWSLVDTNNPTHNASVSGAKYYVNDSNYGVGETYYEGLVPDDWGKSTFAGTVHSELFDYSMWDVISWV